MNPTQTRPDRVLIGILAAVAVLVVVALVVIFTRSAPASLDASTPEGVVQRYTTAAIAGDEAAAAAYLSPAAIEKCADGYDDGSTASRLEKLRVTLIRTVARGETTFVYVRLTQWYDDGGGFGGSESTSDVAFGLVRSGGDWLVDDAPWPLAVCPAGSVSP
jgi:hypothetical protein